MTLHENVLHLRIILPTNNQDWAGMCHCNATSTCSLIQGRCHTPDTVLRNSTCCMYEALDHGTACCGCHRTVRATCTGTMQAFRVSTAHKDCSRSGLKSRFALRLARPVSAALRISMTSSILNAASASSMPAASSAPSNHQG